MNKQPDIVVTADYFGGKAGLQSILNHYYENEVGKLPDEEQQLARVFLEEGLIVSEKRVLISEGVEKVNFNIEPDLLKKLLESRLIRTENTHLGKSFEVSHDALVAPILSSFKERKQLEEQQAIERKLREEQRIAALERKKRTRAYSLAALGFGLFLITAVLFYRNQSLQEDIEFQNTQLESNNKELVNLRIKEQAEKRAKDSINFERYFEKGQREMQIGNYDAAISAYEVATNFNFKNVNLDALIEEANAGLGNKKTVEQLLNTAEQYFEKGNYLAAFRKLEEASAAAKDDPRIQLIIRIKADYASKVYPYFVDRVSAAKTFLPINCQQAKREIAKVEKLEPYLKHLGTIEQAQIIQTINETPCN